MAKNLPASAGDVFDPWVGKIRWRRAWQPAQVFLLGNPIDRGAWQDEVAQELDTMTEHAVFIWKSLRVNLKKILSQEKNLQLCVVMDIDDL